LLCQHLLGDLLAESAGALLGLREAVARALVGLHRGLLRLLADAGGVPLAGRAGLLSLLRSAGQGVLGRATALLDLRPGRVGLGVELGAHASGHRDDALAGTAYDVARVAVADLPDAVGFEVGGREQGLHGLLRPRRLLGSGRQLPLGLRLGRRDMLLGPAARLLEELLGPHAHGLGVGGGRLAESLDLGIGLGAQGLRLVGRGGQQLLGRGLRLRGPGLDQVAGLGVLPVGSGARARQQCLGLMLCLVPDGLRGGQGLLVGALPGSHALGRGALRLGHDLVVMGLCRVHQHAGLLAGVTDDLLGVRGGVVEQALGVFMGSTRLGVELRCLLAQAVCLRGGGLRVLLGASLELVRHALGMAQQRRGAIAASGFGGRADGTVLHGGHARILPNDRGLWEGGARKSLPDGDGRPRAGSRGAARGRLVETGQYTGRRNRSAHAGTSCATGAGVRRARRAARTTARCSA